MPAGSLKPDRATVYLDWSTLVDAFKGSNVAAAADATELTRIVDRASRTANLCLSFIHLYELMRWTDEDARLTCAVWLDHLDTVWLRFPEEVHNLELENLLLGAAAGDLAVPRVPAAPSFLSLFSYDGHDEALSWALQRNSLAAFVKEIGSSRLMPRIEHLAALSTTWSERLWQDRTAGLSAHSETEMREFLDRKRDAALLEEALQANQRLARDPNYRVRKGALFLPPEEEFVRSTIRPLSEMKKFLPYAYLQHRARQNRSFQLVRKPSTQSRNFVTATRGDVFDQWHLVGAAYCDVFSCDAATSDSLALGREELGRAAELVRTDTIGHLAAQLRTALPA